MEVDKDLFNFYQTQIRNACYDIENAKTLAEAKKFAKKADGAAILLLQVAVTNRK